MITDQIVHDDNDLRSVTDNILRDAGLSIKDSGGEVTFAGKEPVRKTVMKARVGRMCHGGERSRRGRDLEGADRRGTDRIACIRRHG